MQDKDRILPLMDTRTEKEFKSYSKGALKYNSDVPARFKWYGYTEEEIFKHYDEFSNLIPPNATSVLEPGCGSGKLAEVILRKRPDISYRGFDIVPKNIEDAEKRNLNARFHIGNYWAEMEEVPDWDFVISHGTLFSTTDQLFISLLFDLMNSASQRGFAVLSLRGSWGISAPLLEEKMKSALETSRGVSRYYFKGKRDFLQQKLIKRNHPFFLWRNKTKAKMPKIPKILTSAPEGLL